MMNTGMPKYGPLGLLAIAMALATASSAGLAATGAASGDIPLIGPKGELHRYGARYPKRGRHVRYVVEVNAKGQIARIRSSRPSKDRRFDALTYGNVVQLYIRRNDGRAISGIYKIGYDYDPKTQIVKRTVKLIHAGGVDPTALGLVDVYKEINRQNAEKMKAALEKIHLQPAPTSTP